LHTAEGLIDEMVSVGEEAIALAILRLIEVKTKKLILIKNY
jgi:hypothetical protein